LNEVPIQLPPVAGIIIAQPSTPLSHINLLVKGWGVPNAYIKNAHQLLKEFDGWWVSFETRRDTYVIKRADLGQVKEYQQRMASRPDLIKPRSDLTVTRIALLNQQRARDVTAYGGKSANLGEMIRARLPGIIVPSGFTVPFFYYDQFISDNNLDESIHEMMNDQKFVHDPTFRRRRLADLRERIQDGALNDQLRADVLRLVHTQFSGKGLFARSSSNSEDLPNFSGAGIHSSVPNVKGDHQLMEAIKTVWASLWNFEAYEARERAGIDHGQVYMAVLIQEGINADSAGVMLTTDPYDRENKSAYYISAKRGLGIKVVEGKRVAEQIIFRPQTNTIQVLTRSAEDSLLTFDEKGGVKEVPISGERAVLTDEMIRKLVKAAQDIKRVFGGKDQDIEWIYVGGQIYIVQARPFVA
jgi:phosphoenolpyruvate synthase/pyruvate phosphate dikinase